jgi:hypothetical protein
MIAGTDIARNNVIIGQKMIAAIMKNVKDQWLNMINMTINVMINSKIARPMIVTMVFKHVIIAQSLWIIKLFIKNLDSIWNNVAHWP